MFHPRCYDYAKLTLFRRVLSRLLFSFCLLPSALLADWSIRGNWSLQSQLFFQEPLHQADQSHNTSLSVEAEIYREIGDDGAILLNPFLRVDQHDEDRSAFDLREAYYTTSAGSLSFKLGLGEVFWGVTEFQNIVDIINQRDRLGDIRGREKFGQPMLNLLVDQDWGLIDLYLLPGFRPGSFASVEGRPRPPLTVDENRAVYEAGNAERHVDVAGRISGSMGPVDLGLHFFQGTSREPILRYDTDTGTLIPFYFQTLQLGIDAQATFESWLLKLELAHRSSDVRQSSTVVSSGFEYSFVGVLDTSADLGLVFEYVGDSQAQETLNPWQDDIFLGMRLALNDAQSTEAILGMAADMSGGGQFFQLEASRRIGTDMKLSVDAYIWSSTDDDSALSQFNAEDLVQLQLSWFY